MSGSEREKEERDREREKNCYAKLQILVIAFPLMVNFLTFCDVYAFFGLAAGFFFSLWNPMVNVMVIPTRLQKRARCLMRTFNSFVYQIREEAKKKIRNNLKYSHSTH